MKAGEECFLSAAFWEITKSTGERQLPLSWQNTHKFHIKLLSKVRQYNPPLLSHVSTDLRWGRKGRTAQMQGRVVLYNSSFKIVSNSFQRQSQVVARERCKKKEKKTNKC